MIKRRYLYPTIVLAALVCVWLVPAAAQTLAGIKIGNLCTIMAGSAAPESSVTAAICAIYTRSGTAGLYLKETGSSNTGWGQVATLANAVTLTNKTLDAEGTGNVVTFAERRWMHMGICYTAASPDAYEDNGWNLLDNSGTNAPVFSCHAGTNVLFATADFVDGATTHYLQKALALPADWSGVIDMRIFWNTPATTGNVVWQVQTACSASAASVDPSWNAANTVTQAAQGTTLRLSIAALTSITTTGCTAGSMLWLRFLRDPAHASDTLADMGSVIGVEVTYRRAM